VLVIGYGNVGGAAARTAHALGAQVTVLGTNPERLRRFQATLPGVTCRLNSREMLEREVPAADLVIGAILISTYDTEPMIGEDLVSRMRPGSVIVDVTAGYGAGYLPTFDRLTTLPDPVYERFGVLHCKIDAFPAAVPRTATRAVGPVIVPYLIALGRAIYDGTPDPVSAAGRITAAGQITHPEVERHMRMLAGSEQP
jgi:alanine dehydrogenase